jgi:putative ABC transport system permease protein
MRALSNARLAFRALRAHKLRAALTSLGVVIGVAAVITMVAVGAGARERVAEQIRSMGANLVLVWAQSATVGGARIGARSRPVVTEEDAWALQREIPFIDAAAPFSTSRVGLVHRNQNWTTVLNAVTPEFFAVQDWDVAAGRPITREESDAAAKVIVLGGTVAGKLFGDADPVGQTVRVQNVPFRVVGVLDRKGQSAWGQDQDDLVLIPLSTARRNVIGRNPSTARAVESISVKVAAADLLPAAMQEIRAVLRQRHRLQPDQEDDFAMHDLTEMTRAQESSSRVLSMLLAAIASVSLLTGGVGIMNIMLVSVTERTREIGVRIAVGARARDIFAQFLVEALTLSLAGGLAGVAVGLAAAHAVAYVARWRILIQPEAVLVAVGFAVAVGVAFGVYPARKAARLDPIEALRFE